MEIAKLLAGRGERKKENRKLAKKKNETIYN